MDTMSPSANKFLIRPYSLSKLNTAQDLCGNLPTKYGTFFVHVIAVLNSINKNTINKILALITPFYCQQI